MLKNESSDNDKLGDLLSQEITDEELRDLLTRLGEIEFAWSPRTTLKDVVEATSANPVVIGRLLAEIRKEDWEERFGLRLSEVEERVTRVEKQASASAPKEVYIVTPPYSRPTVNVQPLSTQQGLFIIVKVFLIGGAILGTFLYMAYLAGQQQPPTYGGTYRPGLTVTSEGKTTYVDEHGDLVTNDNGKVRPANSHEAASFGIALPKERNTRR